MPDANTIQGRVNESRTRYAPFIFKSDDGQFAVISITCEDGTQDIIVSGAVGQAIAGMDILCEGQWKRHPKFGEQFHAFKSKMIQPRNEAGIVKYLSSSLIKGCGPATARKIYKVFGDQTLQVMRDDPSRLAEVDGIGKQRAEKLADAVRDSIHVEEIMIWLFDRGINQSLATRIFKKYGLQSMEVLTSNPYVLVDDLYGVGFRTADAIAAEMGVGLDSVERIRAAILYLLKENESSGHTTITHADLQEQVAGLIGAGDMGTVIDEMHDTDELRSIPSGGHGEYVVQRRMMYAMERAIANRLVERNYDSVWWFNKVNIASCVRTAEHSRGMTLDDSQRAAAERMLCSHMSLLTGRPGTGKTSTLKVILDVVAEQGFTILQAAPTGKAARKMTDSTGREAMTIHRLLEYDPYNGGFQYDAENPLDCHVLVIDEASMLDTYLMYAVTQALAAHTQVFLVGDTNQLPSVGAGRVLGDLIESGVISTNELTKIHRQAAGSAIITNAHAIIEGRSKEIADGADFRFIEFAPSDRVAQGLPKLITDKIAPALDIDDPIRDIQVLTASHKGPIGTMALNERLGQHMNPAPLDRFTHRKLAFATGDKVIVTRNNYDLDIYNGTQATITRFAEDAIWIVTEDEKTVELSGSARDDISPAWCITVHKSQGSEFPVVVLPIGMNQRMLLDRNWLYTAVTRAKAMCVIVGEGRALRHAIKTMRSDKRRTLLLERITAAA